VKKFVRCDGPRSVFRFFQFSTTLIVKTEILGKFGISVASLNFSANFFGGGPV